MGGAVWFSVPNLAPFALQTMSVADVDFQMHFGVRWLVYLAVLALRTASGAAPDWTLEASAPWQPRDSQAEWVFQDRMWIGGGWFNSMEAPPRDVWSSKDGKSWNRSESDAPWIHSDLAMSLTFAGKMWLMGGWFNGRLPGHEASREVWSSGDGEHWIPVTKEAPWKARCAGAVVGHKGRMWLLGGIEDYYFGNPGSLRNDVWSSEDGREWKEECAEAPWAARAYHQAVVHRGRIFILGGGNYVPIHVARNDVWSSEDGVHWQLETDRAPWGPRLWFSAAVYRGRIWVLGGWSKAQDNFGDVWHSEDGINWQRLETPNTWKARHEHSVFVFKDRLWIAGGHARPLSNEVWSLHLPQGWAP